MDSLTGGWPFLVQMAASLTWQYWPYDDLSTKEKLKKMENEFRFQTEKHFHDCWTSLTMREQRVFQTIVGMNVGKIIPTDAEIYLLKRYGLITADEQCFSSAFWDWIKEKEGDI